jgi:NAD(P)-dependent dehydrogenase (short-subunit alcohol dehydrogenase family)
MDGMGCVSKPYLELQTTLARRITRGFVISTMRSLHNLVAVVTGASRGFGVGIAEALVRSGCRVWITGRDASALEAAARSMGAEPFVGDVSDSAAWDRLFADILSRAGRLDILVNNAGEGVRIGPVAEQTDDAILQSIASNLTGSILGCRRAAEIMQRQKDGLIVNIGSVCSHHAWPGWGVYSAAKAGLLQFTRCLLTELRPHGVRVTSILPSWGQTNFTSAAQLAPREPEVLEQCISPANLGDLVVQIAQMPPHLVAEEIKLWPMVQPIAQL